MWDCLDAVIKIVWRHMPVTCLDHFCRHDLPVAVWIIFTLCSLSLSATSQQYFSLRTNQQPVSSTFLSEQISTSHQPNE
jgi:hypothetical protein